MGLCGRISANSIPIRLMAASKDTNYGDDEYEFVVEVRLTTYSMPLMFKTGSGCWYNRVGS